MKKSHYLIKLWFRVAALVQNVFRNNSIDQLQQTVFGKYWFSGKLSIENKLF